MRPLYEIDHDIEMCVDHETGEIDVERLNDLQMEREAKIDGILCYIKDLNAEAAAIREEEKALAERRHRAEKEAAGLTRFVSLKLAGERFETSRNAVSWRRSHAVVIHDEPAALGWCLDHAQSAIKQAAPTLDKMALKDIIRSGIQISGVTLEERNSIQIK